MFNYTKHVDISGNLYYAYKKLDEQFIVRVTRDPRKDPHGNPMFVNDFNVRLKPWVEGMFCKITLRDTFFITTHKLADITMSVKITEDNFCHLTVFVPENIVTISDYNTIRDSAFIEGKQLEPTAFDLTTWVNKIGTAITWFLNNNGTYLSIPENSSFNNSEYTSNTIKRQVVELVRERLAAFSSETMII